MPTKSIFNLVWYNHGISFVWLVESLSFLHRYQGIRPLVASGLHVSTAIAGFDIILLCLRHSPCPIDTVWLLGNLARATYVGSSDFMWPFSYDECDDENRDSQEVTACARVGHYGMQPGVGRGAPEIDVLEAMQGDHSKLPNTHVRRPYVSASLQVSSAETLWLKARQIDVMCFSFNRLDLLLFRLHQDSNEIVPSLENCLYL